MFHCLTVETDHVPADARNCLAMNGPLAGGLERDLRQKQKVPDIEEVINLVSNDSKPVITTFLSGAFRR